MLLNSTFFPATHEGCMQAKHSNRSKRIPRRPYSGSRSVAVHTKGASSQAVRAPAHKLYNNLIVYKYFAARSSSRTHYPARTCIPGLIRDYHTRRMRKGARPPLVASACCNGLHRRPKRGDPCTGFCNSKCAGSQAQGPKPAKQPRSKAPMACIQGGPVSQSGARVLAAGKDTRAVQTACRLCPSAGQPPCAAP
jgi:hypothetical protein